jgi:large subunit ribosomal protein L13
MPKTQDINRKWWIVDAKNQVLGRLASQVAAVLRGKHKVVFTPHVNNGDHVIIINASQIILTGNKWAKKAYYRTSGRPGGLSSEKYSDLRNTKPERILEYALKGMLPKNSLGHEMFMHVKIYSGDKHPHSGQKPNLFSLSN